MTRQPRQMAELADLSAMLRESRLADLARMRARQRDVETAIAALDALAAEVRAIAHRPDLDPRALDRHEHWITAERRALMIRLARSRIETEAALRQAAPAVGRADVLARLAARAQAGVRKPDC